MQEQSAVGWAPNQVVAHNMTKARELRGLTQVEVAERLAMFTGNKWSQATVAQAEGTVHGGRMRNFTVNELFALARTFDLPILWFLVPPAPDSDVPAAGATFADDPSVQDWRRLLLYAVGHRGNYGELAAQSAPWHNAMKASLPVPEADVLDDDGAERDFLAASLAGQREPMSIDDALVASLHGLVTAGLPGGPLGPDEIAELSGSMHRLATALEALANYPPARTLGGLEEDEMEAEQ